jgi:hypothetical protein
LDHEAPNADYISNHKKDDLSAFLLQITVGHYGVTSASVNYRTRHMAQKQTGDLKMSVTGGMSEVSNLGTAFSSFDANLLWYSQKEMEQWWKHHQGQTPVFNNKADKDEVKDYTG